LSRQSRRWVIGSGCRAGVGAHAAGGEDVTKVAGQAVAQVDGRVHRAAEHRQQRAQLQARRGALQPLSQLGVLGQGVWSAGKQGPVRAAHQLQCQPRLAGAAGEVDVVAHLRLAALHGQAGAHLAHHRDADVERAARGVAAHQRTGVLVGQRKQALGKGAEPRVAGLGQGQGQREAEWARAHGGQIAEVHRQRLVAQRLRVNASKKMPALDQHVGGHGQLMSGPGLQQCAVIADAQHHG